MSEEAIALEPEAPEIELEASPEAAPTPEPAPDYEDRAMAMGWTPKGQFKGDPDKWVDAKTFVTRGEEFLPFLKANNRRLEQALERANAQIERLDGAVKESIKHISKAEARAYDKARRDLEAELEQATLAGDTEGVKAVTKEIVSLEKEVRADEAPKADADQEPKVKAFVAENPWFEADPVMRAAAVELCGQFAKQGLDIDAQLKATAKRIREEFPHKFTNPRREQPAAVEGSSGLAKRAATHTYSDLPPEAKAMCDDFVSSIKGMTREKYVREYFAQEKAK